MPGSLGLDGERPAHIAQVSVGPLADPRPKKWHRTDAHALLVVPAHDLGPVNIPDHNIAALRAYGQVCSLVDVRLQARVHNACERRGKLKP